MEIDGSIKFIDTKGNVVFDPHILYDPDMEGYVFHNDLCIIENEKDNRKGLIDKQGNWVLQPEYISIDISDSLYVIDNGKEQSVIDAKLQPIIPFMKAKLIAHSDMIETVLEDHTIRTYSRRGELISDFNISETSQLLYDTDEIHYSALYEYDDMGNVTSKNEEREQSMRKAVAHCMKYQTAYGWYGLMSPDGTFITPPDYNCIEAVGADLYLCSDDHGNGILLNGKGAAYEKTDFDTISGQDTHLLGVLPFSFYAVLAFFCCYCVTYHANALPYWTPPNTSN